MLGGNLQHIADVEVKACGCEDIESNITFYLGHLEIPQIPSTIYSKLDRADSKVLAFQNSISEWKRDNKVTLYAEFRPNKHGLNIKCDMEGLAAPLENWRVDFGEIIYTLRSTLDNLIFYCAKRHLDPPIEPRNLYFPIFTDEGEYKKRAVTTTSQLENNIRDLVEKIQPYHRHKVEVEGNPGIDPLVSLNFLSNFDKHRMPIPFLVPPNEISINHCFQFHSNEDASANVPPNVIVHTDPLIHEKTVLEFITNCPVKMASGNIQIAANVALEVNNQTRDIVEVVNQLAQYSRLVVQEFEKTLTN